MPPRPRCSWYGRHNKHKRAQQQKTTVMRVYTKKMGHTDMCDADGADMVKRRVKSRGEEEEAHSHGLEISFQQTPVWLCQLMTQSICLHPCVVTKCLDVLSLQRGSEWGCFNYINHTSQVQTIQQGDWSQTWLALAVVGGKRFGKSFDCVAAEECFSPPALGRLVL